MDSNLWPEGDAEIFLGEGDDTPPVGEPSSFSLPDGRM